MKLFKNCAENWPKQGIFSALENSENQFCQLKKWEKMYETFQNSCRNLVKTGDF